MLREPSFPAIRRTRLETLQINVGYRCNQACVHCHVSAGPARTEEMGRDVADTVLAFLSRESVSRLDVTGGAPELNPYFRYLVVEARQLGVHVIDRCNLTVLALPEHAELPAFLAAWQVEVIASLPCYLEENVDRQRGRGVFRASLEGLRRLNAAGYARPGTGLELGLVYNPQGPDLPPPQDELEREYREHLAREGVEFTRLFTLANMPIGRFGQTLAARGELVPYLELLRANHSDGNLEQVMCRTLLSVDWRGFAYDCDFNQMAGLPLGGNDGGRTRLADLLADVLEGRAIAVADHCFGCTAGQGSSCSGALGEGRRTSLRQFIGT